MFDGLINSIVEGIQNALAGLITNLFELIVLILQGAFANPDVGVGADFTASGMVSADPMTWSGGNPWGVVRGLSEAVVVPIGTLILLVVLVNELVQIMVSGNQFENAGIGAFVKWSVKAVIGIILVSNVFNIATGIFTMGSWIGQEGTAFLNQAFADVNVIIDPQESDIGAMLIIIIILFLVLLGVIILFLAILITLAGRMIEIFMYLAIAPVPMATYMNSEWRQMGNGWLRGMFALAFQAFFVVVAIAIFTGILNTVLGNAFNDGITFDVVPAALVLLSYTLTLVFTILRSGSISKSIFGAS